MTNVNSTIKIGIQGGLGSFNEDAILSYISSKKINNYFIDYLYTTDKVLDKLNNKKINLGLFAIHNSLGGLVDESIDVLGKYKFNVVDKIVIKINHALMIRKDMKLESIRQIMAHPQVLSQCRNNLFSKYPYLELVSGSGNLIDTAFVAKELSAGFIDSFTAVLGNLRLSELYNLQIIDNNLQDNDENYTSFLLVANCST